VGKRLLQAAVIVLALFVLAQLVRPARTNPPIDASRTIEAHLGAANGLAAVLNRSCGDCHSNRTTWSAWYARVAPLSWAMSYAVTQGRKAVNFSEWSSYPPDVQRQMLVASCQAISAGKMPDAYTLFRSETRLSAADLETICSAARYAAASQKAGTP
jgi:hypothetical protein